MSSRAAEPQLEPGLAARRDSILDVHDLSVEYLLESGVVLAVDQVSFSVKESEFVAIVGESGCGKSTLLFAIAAPAVGRDAAALDDRHGPSFHA